MPCVAVSSCSRIGPLMGSILQPSSSTRDAALYCPMPAIANSVLVVKCRSPSQNPVPQSARQS